jgi:hypothetical protein
MSLNRRKKVLSKILGNEKAKRGKIRIWGRVMKDCGYSESYAKNPKQFRQSKKWQELLGGFIPEVVLAEKQHDLLHYKNLRHFHFPKEVKATDKEIKALIESFKDYSLRAIVPDGYGGQTAYYEAPDAKVMKEALEMGHKLYGHFAPEKIEVTKGKYSDLTDEELALRRKVLRDFLMRK